MEEKRTEQLAEISKEIENTVSNGDQEMSNLPSRSSSRGESAPQPFKKSIAEMEEEQRQPTISVKELKALKKARYGEIAENFRYSYVIKNVKTGLVVEIRASSSFHACNIIGWKKNHTRLLEVIDNEKDKEGKEGSESKIEEKKENVEPAVATNA